MDQIKEWFRGAALVASIVLGTIAIGGIVAAAHLVAERIGDLTYIDCPYHDCGE